MNEESLALDMLVERKVDSVDRCSICSEAYDVSGSRTPYSLRDCLHTFCLSCLTESLGPGDIVKCSLCQVETKKRASDDRPLFHKNFAVIKTLEVIKNRILAPEKNACDRCIEVGQHNSAEFCCIECHTHLCLDCWNLVHCVGVLKSHEKVPWSQQRLERVVDNRCPKHKNYHQDVVCLDQECGRSDRLVCSVCERLFHKTHKTDVVLNVARDNRRGLKDKIAESKVVIQRVSQLLMGVEELEVGLKGAQYLLQEKELALQKREKREEKEEEESDEEREEEEEEEREREKRRRVFHGIVMKRNEEILRKAFQDVRSILDSREQELLARLHNIVSEKASILEDQREQIVDFLVDNYERCRGAHDLLGDGDVEFIRHMNQQLDSLEIGLKKEVFLTQRCNNQISIDFSTIGDVKSSVATLGQIEHEGILTSTTVAASTLLKVAPTTKRPLLFTRWGGKISIDDLNKLATKIGTKGRDSNIQASCPTSINGVFTYSVLSSGGEHTMIGWAPAGMELDKPHDGEAFGTDQVRRKVNHPAGGIKGLSRLITTSYDTRQGIISFTVNGHSAVMFQGVNGEMVPSFCMYNQQSKLALQ